MEDLLNLGTPSLQIVFGFCIHAFICMVLDA